MNKREYFTEPYHSFEEKAKKRRLFFEHFNQHGKDVCPICKTKDDKETVLIGIIGTQERHNIEALQLHLECVLDVLLISSDKKFIGARIG